MYLCNADDTSQEKEEEDPSHQKDEESGYRVLDALDASLEGMEELEDATIRFYYGNGNIADWRIARTVFTLMGKERLRVLRLNFYHQPSVAAFCLEALDISQLKALLALDLNFCKKTLLYFFIFIGRCSNIPAKSFNGLCGKIRGKESLLDIHLWVGKNLFSFFLIFF